MQERVRLHLARSDCGTRWIGLCISGLGRLIVARAAPTADMFTVEQVCEMRRRIHEDLCRRVATDFEYSGKKLEGRRKRQYETCVMMMDKVEKGEWDWDTTLAAKLLAVKVPPDEVKAIAWEMPVEADGLRRLWNTEDEGLFAKVLKTVQNHVAEVSGGGGGGVCVCVNARCMKQ